MTGTKTTARLMRSFGLRLRAARITSGYASAADFSADLGIDEYRYRKYERGESVPPLDVLQSICDVTNKSLDFLLLGRSTSSDT